MMGQGSQYIVSRNENIKRLPLFMWAQCRFPVGLENEFHSENPKTKIMKLESILD